jgi:hypothetical protein
VPWSQRSPRSMRIEAGYPARVDAELPTLPIGHSGRLEAVGLTNATGSHALVVRQDEQPRALFTGEGTSGSRERLVVTPLDEDVEIRVDGDALAVWLAQGSVGRVSGSAVPGWANGLGFALVLLVLVFMVIGSVTFFGWLFAAFGWLR